MNFTALLFICAASILSAKEDKQEGCSKNFLVKTDFTNGNLPIVLDGPSANWSYFGNPTSGFIANGGKLIPGKYGVIQDSSTFYRFWPQSPFPELPRIQYSIYDKSAIPILPFRETTFSFKMSSETFNTEKSPIPSQYLTGPNDSRLASAGPYVIDLTTNLIVEFILTNDRIYAGYSRLSLGLLNAPYADFEYFIPVAQRCPSKSHKLELVVNSADKTISYVVDGKNVLKVNNVGYRLGSRQFMVKDLGGTEADVFPQNLWYGFGTYSFLDTYASCGNGVTCPLTHAAISQSQNALGPQAYDPQVGPPTIATYWDNAGLNANWLWGQGSKSVVQKIEVFFKTL